MRDSAPSDPGNDATPGLAEEPARSDAGGDAPDGRIVRAVVDVAAGARVGTGDLANPLHRDSYVGATSRGYSDALGRGFELTFALVIVGGLGWLLDRAFGTAPIFLLAFAVFGFAGVGVKLWYGYDLEMRKHEDGAIWNRGKSS